MITKDVVIYPTVGPGPGADEDDKQGAPLVVNISTANAPSLPGLIISCKTGPDDLSMSPTCPVLRWKGHDYWALSYRDNRNAIALVSRDANGKPILRRELRGARYVWRMEVEPKERIVTFWGQSNRSVTVSWDDLD